MQSAAGTSLLVLTFHQQSDDRLRQRLNHAVHFDIVSFCVKRRTCTLRKEPLEQYQKQILETQNGLCWWGTCTMSR